VLERRISESGTVFYASSALEAIGVPHAFSTRLGGISPAPFDSLNLGNPNGCPIQDDRGRIEANYARLLAAADCPRRDMIHVHQVHANQVALVQESKPFDVSLKADALVSTDPQRTISVRVADCVPVLIAREDGKKVAAVHAGWRGIVAGVIPATLRQMSGAPLVAAVGPCIGFNAFEVGPEVLAEFEKIFGSAAPIRRDPSGKGRADLAAAAKLQLLAGGLCEDRIDCAGLCTFANPGEFFSHRRDHGATGRMAALIAPAPS
jgi:purine-nucleoside/S-methyl-5'-thioadenosine phosphorylase / adenosine deaminase